MVAETLKLSEVLRDFGPKEQKIWDNTMLHPSITNVISALVDQVRSQNETINELMSKNSDSPPTRHVHAEENGAASVQEKVRDIEDRLVVRSSSEEDENSKDIEASVSFSAVHDRIFERLENLEAHLPNLVDVSMLDEHKQKTKLALKRYHESQANISSSDDNRAEIAKMAAEVLSVASSATESISESISADYEYMVKSLNIVRDDLVFLVESLYGQPNASAGASPIVVSPFKKGAKNSESVEETSRRLRSSVTASGSNDSATSLVGDTKSLHNQMNTVLGLLNRQQERTAEVEEKVQSAERVILEQQEKTSYVEEKVQSAERAILNQQERTTQVEKKVLSAASSATESISESISVDNERMVKSLNIIRDDLVFLVESLYGKATTSAAASPIVVSPFQKSAKKASLSAEETSRRLRSSISASGSTDSGSSLLGDTKSLHNKMNTMLELLDRQQERTTEVEDKVRTAERVIMDQQERISTLDNLGKENHVGVGPSPMSVTNTVTGSGKKVRGSDEEESKILKLQMKDMNSRLDALGAQVEDTHAMYKRPTSSKIIQSLEKMQRTVDALTAGFSALKKDQDVVNRKAMLTEERFRKATNERVKAVSTQLAKQSEMARHTASRVEEVEGDCKSKIKQCRTDIANLKKQVLDRPGAKETSLTEVNSKIRSLEKTLETIKSGLESSKKWASLVMTEKIKKLSDQTAKQSDLILGVSADLTKLDAKYKDSISSLSKKALTKSQGKTFIASEVKVLREYIESRWQEIADQLKESIAVTKESIKITKELPSTSPLAMRLNENPSAPSESGKYETILALVKELEANVLGQSETHRDISIRLFGLEGKFESALQRIPAAERSENIVTESDMSAWKDAMEAQCAELANKVDLFGADSTKGLKAADAIEGRLESLIDFLKDKIEPKDKASEEVEKKLMSFHRTVLKMANFDEICITEISRLTERVGVLEESLESREGKLDASASAELREKLNQKISYQAALELLRDLKHHTDEALSHKLDVKTFLAASTKIGSPYKHLLM